MMDDDSGLPALPASLLAGLAPEELAELREQRRANAAKFRQMREGPTEVQPPEAEPQHAESALLELVRAAQTRPAPISAEHLEELLTGPLPNMGRPKVPPPTGKRGRPASRDQYDRARARRDRLEAHLRQWHHRVVTLPKLGRACGWLSDSAFTRITREVLADQSIKPHRRAAEVSRRCAARGVKAPNDMKTIRRALRSLAA